MAVKLYAYVGAASIRRGQAPAGNAIATLDELHAWLAQRAPEVAATFIIDRTGRLLLADRRSEHVACAGGQPVQAAGEMFFAFTPLRLAEVTNQSTGYCPEPACWAAVAAALDRLGLPHPDGFTPAFDFRRCPACGQLNIVKDRWFHCGCCTAPLPAAWNLAPAENS